jgi:SAM-dependent methyltransferase
MPRLLLHEEALKDQMYACPNCKSDLPTARCPKCGFQSQSINGIRVFFTGSAISNRYEEIGAFYDNLYEATEDAWRQLAARGPEFVEFVASLVMQEHPIRYLDVGCGEGYILAAVNAPEKFGLDISRKAVQAASKRSMADLCIGFSEELPYPSEHFDVITSIGVITHLIDDLAATREICRALQPGGCYIAGLYLPPRLGETILAKVLEFTYPRPRPLAFVRWALHKATRSIRVTSGAHCGSEDEQPVRRYYAAKQLERMFEQAGFVVEDMITKAKMPGAPLSGQHFRIYVLRKKSTLAARSSS